MEMLKAIIILIAGFVLLIKGADFFVEGSSSVAKKLRVPPIIIGLTIVAVGTSLPELVTSVVASRKNEVDMALGNVLGSNIFNILLILGTASVISPMTFVMENIIDIIILTAVSVLVYIFAWTREKIERKEGIVMLATYVIFMIYISVR